MLSYALKGICHYRRINFVVLIAVAISTAVIGGSLIVGDSVRYSLRQMTEQRLGQITDIMTSPIFFREAMVADFQADKAAASRDRFAPGILATGSVELGTEDGSIRRAGSVTLLGVEQSGWDLLETSDIAVPTGRQVVLGYRTAQELDAREGDDVSVWVEVPTSIPRDSLLGEREDVNVEMVLTVSAVIPETTGASRFHLNPGQQLPYNAFLPLTTLQDRLGLEAVEASRRNPIAQPAKINTILVGCDGEEIAQLSDGDFSDNSRLNTLVSQYLTLEDVGIKLRSVTDRGYVNAETDRMIFSDHLADSVLAATESLGLIAEPTVVYLSNEISAAERIAPNERYSMYSILAGMSFNNAEPFGTFRLTGGAEVPTLSDSEILLSSWLAEDLKVKAGDQVETTWHEVGSHGELPELVKTFTVAGVLAPDDEASIDPDLTPQVNGVTDVESFDEVDQPFEMQMDRLTERDDLYWDERRATPKAFLSLSTAVELWSSRYGTFTSIRVAASGGDRRPTEGQLNDLAGRLAFEIPRQIDPTKLGLTFRPVRLEGLRAAVGANDFTQLFIGFSFFLILSAIILASLMFRLGIQQRIRQFGLLNAVGWPNGRVQKLFLIEGLLVCLGGAVLGVAGAVYFGKFMIYALTTWWVGAVGTQFLQLDVQPFKLVIAAWASMTMAALVIYSALNSFRQIGIRDQLSGNATAAEYAESTGLWVKLRPVIGVGSILTAITIPVVVINNVIPDGEAFGGMTWQMVCFFVAGFACLLAGLYLLSITLGQRSRRDRVRGTASNLRSLAFANAARSPMRSMLTTALIAFATFVIVAVGAGRRNPLSEVPDFRSGNGGFSLVAESAQPILFDINTPDGRAQLGIEQDGLLDSANIYPFSVKAGSDASCVNLYQTRVPTVLGASAEFVSRGGFRFADTKGDNPWQLLQAAAEPNGNGIPVIPVIGDANTLMYSLKKNIGSRIYVPNDDDPKYVLEVVGKLDGSVFQGVLIAADESLKQVEAEVSGAQYFLIETTSLSEATPTSTVLETQLNNYGFDAELVNDRLAGFLAVQNTYLSTFQMLGGLGLLVGTFGLAAVMMRNVVERRSEIALMRAVGFTSTRVSALILIENCVLLLWGIGLGTTSALLAMLPHLRSTGADLPWQPLSITLVAVALIGVCSCVFAVRSAAGISIRGNLAAE